MVNNLKKCPFCGRPATIVRHPGINQDGKNPLLTIGANQGTWYVGCSYPFFEELDNLPPCEVVPAACWYAKLEDAIRVWESRN